MWALMVLVISLGAIESPMHLPGFKPWPGTRGISDRGFSPLQGRAECQGSKDATGQGVRLSATYESAKRGGILTFPLMGPPVLGFSRLERKEPGVRIAAALQRRRVRDPEGQYHTCSAGCCQVYWLPASWPQISAPL